MTSHLIDAATTEGRVEQAIDGFWMPAPGHPSSLFPVRAEPGDREWLLGLPAVECPCPECGDPVRRWSYGDDEQAGFLICPNCRIMRVVLPR